MIRNQLLDARLQLWQNAFHAGALRSFNGLAGELARVAREFRPPADLIRLTG